MEIIIHCEDCTRIERTRDKYAVVKFNSLTEAVQHITEYGHDVRIELEPPYDED